MNNKNFYLFYGEDKAVLNKEIDNLNVVYTGSLREYGG